jgi:hypothetical protein
MIPPLLALATGRRVRPRQAPATHAKELGLHIDVADLLRRHARPEWRWTHIPAGEPRDRRSAAKLKAMGMQPGWADFILIAPGGLSHLLELKRADEELSDLQEDFQTWAIVNRVPHAIATSMREVLTILTHWNCLRPEAQTIIGAEQWIHTASAVRQETRGPTGELECV